MPKYTFLLPAYKAKFLEESLASIQRQTYTNYQVIISDDCSPEDIYSICEPYLEDKRFSYRRNEENIGGKSLVEHWNLLVDLCQTDYLIMASDDDMYSRYFLEEVDKLVSLYPEVNLIRARVSRIDESGEPFQEDPLFESFQNQLNFLYDVYCSRHIHCIANYVFKTQSLKTKGGFVDFPLAWFSDDATIMLNSEDGVANTSTILFGFRSSESNISCERKTSKENAWRKIVAAKQFHSFATPYINEIVCISNKVNDNKKRVLMFEIRHRTRNQILVYISSIKFVDFRNTYMWLCENDYVNGTLEKIVIWNRWLKNRISRFR